MNDSVRQRLRFAGPGSGDYQQRPTGLCWVGLVSMYDSSTLHFVHMFQMVQSHDLSFARNSTADPLQVRLLAKHDRQNRS
jgi:hypothetical protein